MTQRPQATRVLPVAGFRLRPPGAVAWIATCTLAQRDIMRFLKEWPETVVAPTFSTVLYFAVFALALGPTRETADGAAALDFVLPGLVLFTILIRAAETTGYSIAFDKIEAVIEDVLMSPLRPAEMVLAWAVAGAVTGIITGIPTLIAAVVLFDLPIESPALVLVFGVLTAITLALAGIFIGLWTETWNHASAAFGFVLVPVAFLSGTFAPVSAMPDPVASLVRVNPIYYAIDGFRTGFLGQQAEPVWLGAAILLATIAALAGGAWWLIRIGYGLKS